METIKFFNRAHLEKVKMSIIRFESVSHYQLGIKYREVARKIKKWYAILFSIDKILAKVFLLPKTVWLFYYKQYH